MPQKRPMTLKTFAAYLSEHIEEFLEEIPLDSIELAKIRRNNGIELTALNIIQTGCDTYPLIYIEPYYQSYLAGIEVEDIMGAIAHAYMNSMQEDFAISLEDLCNLENIREHIIFHLVNRERNQDLLERVPHLIYLDFAIIYRVVFKRCEAGIASVIIDYNLLKGWRLSELDIYEYALRNSPRIFPPVVERLSDVIHEVAGRAVNLDDYEIYILSNEEKLNGATTLIYGNAIKVLADQLDKDLFILPSSVHEVLLIPFDDKVDARRLRMLVTDSNRRVISEDEILSDSLYLYQRLNDKIIICG